MYVAKTVGLLAVSAAVLTSAVRADEKADAKTAKETPATPARQWVIYILPHSHVDIGYTHLQPEVLKMQWNNLETGIALARKSADYPPGAQFKWNAEVLWPIERYLRDAPPEKQAVLLEAIKKGWVGIDALYGNLLTGLCRPEELLRSLEYSQRLARRTGAPADAAMISDVPGYTWGLTSTMAHSGVKYFSFGPNWSDRIGWTLAAWQDKPFWWISPSGREKVLCWAPTKGYALGHILNAKLPPFLPSYMKELERSGYPYDIAYLRWNIGGDNGPPDGKLSDTVRDWNAAHASPKLIIATTREAFGAFAERYGQKLPEVRGDFTPYWEDGAGSSARETAVNRAATERLVQAETLWVLLNPRRFPADEFQTAWRSAMLYSEHTWGAYNSIAEPDKQFVKDQWKIKQAFALDADAQSRKLLEASLPALSVAGGPVTAIDVFNTLSWARTGLVVLPKQMKLPGDIVVGPEGEAIASQRLSGGELVLLAKDVPPLAGRRYTIRAGAMKSSGTARTEGTRIRSSAVSLELDPALGTIVGLHGAGANANLSDTKSGVGLNRYYYVSGSQVKAARQAGPAKIAVKESGPLVQSLTVESDAPGCTSFVREYRVVEGLDSVEIINVLDKLPVRQKEGVHLGFAFNVPDGVMRMDIPWAVVRPELDQIPGACKNWFTVQRWVDVSNAEHGVTWATLDAPLVEVGAITADKIGSCTEPKHWLDRLAPSQTLYSWVMNNHWHTNYRAEQSGRTTFRYALRPHGKYDQAAAQRFGIEQSQPLCVATALGEPPTGKSRLLVEPRDVIVTALKPSADGKAWIVRLFGAGGRDAQATLAWAEPRPKSVAISSLVEETVRPVSGLIEVPAYGIVTLRVELP